MLDDVLSAVDAQVAQWILNNAILGPLADNKTCILCTHNTQVTLLLEINRRSKNVLKKVTNLVRPVPEDAFN